MSGQVQLVAVTPFKCDGRRYREGEAFTASQEVAEGLVAAGVAAAVADEPKGKPAKSSKDEQQ